MGCGVWSKNFGGGVENPNVVKRSGFEEDLLTNGWEGRDDVFPGLADKAELDDGVRRKFEQYLLEELASVEDFVACESPFDGAGFHAMSASG